VWGEDTELDTGVIGSAAPAVAMFIPLRERLNGSPNLWKRVREQFEEACDEIAGSKRTTWAVRGGGEDGVHDGTSGGREVVDAAQRGGGRLGKLGVDEGLDLGGEEDALHGTVGVGVDVGGADRGRELGNLCREFGFHSLGGLGECAGVLRGCGREGGLEVGENIGASEQDVGCDQVLETGFVGAQEVIPIRRDSEGRRILGLARLEWPEILVGEDRGLERPPKVGGDLDLAADLGGDEEIWEALLQGSGELGVLGDVDLELRDAQFGTAQPTLDIQHVGLVEVIEGVGDPVRNVLREGRRGALRVHPGRPTRCAVRGAEDGQGHDGRQKRNQDKPNRGVGVRRNNETAGADHQIGGRASCQRDRCRPGRGGRNGDRKLLNDRRRWCGGATRQRRLLNGRSDRPPTTRTPTSQARRSDDRGTREGAVSGQRTLLTKAGRCSRRRDGTRSGPLAGRGYISVSKRKEEEEGKHGNIRTSDGRRRDDAGQRPTKIHLLHSVQCHRHHSRRRPVGGTLLGGDHLGAQLRRNGGGTPLLATAPGNSRGRRRGCGAWAASDAGGSAARAG
jgi:hypothetical protein